MIDQLSHGNIWEEKKIFDLSYIYCMERFLYWYDRNKIIEQEQKQRQNA